MPEIKNTFVQGRMNKDFDERLVPNGQYRDAMNVQVSTSEESDIGTVQNILGNERVDIGGVPSNFTCVGSIADEKNNTVYWFISSTGVDAIMQYNEATGYSPVFIDTLGVLKFPNRTITAINIIDDLLFWTDGFNEPRKINITRSKKGTTATIGNPSHTKLVVNDVVTTDDVTEDHITVIRKKPTASPNIKINLSANTSSPDLFEKILCRFSLRYKYEDGEYSAFGPFTDVVFNPIYPDTINQDNFYDIKEPYNLAMLNSIESIDIFDFRAPDMPEDVVQIDILYKQEDSPIVYSVASIKPNDPIPDGQNLNYWNDLGFNQGVPNLVSSKYGGKYPVTTENIYAAVPSNQLLRPWDNVPKKALAQEVTGNRIIYGNYDQNYNLDPNISIIIGYGDRKNISSFLDGGLPSIKSQRNYQLGFVFGDKYGRETPVNTSTEGAVNVPWGNPALPNASKSHQLTTRLKGSIPDWADYYKIFVKETSTEYYNLIMDRAYTPTAEIAGIDGTTEEKNHLWLSYSSSDRNKLQIEDYIILKKKVGPGELQFPTENRFKILDIKNDAPDAIKFKFSTLANIPNGSNALDSQSGVAGIFPNVVSIIERNRIDVKGADTIHIDKSNFEGQDGASLVTDSEFSHDVKNIYISWKELAAGGSSSGQETRRYQVIDIRISDTNPTKYILKLAEQISEADATLAAGTVSSTSPWTTTAAMNSNLIFKVERKDVKDTDEFSGRFFVKVVADDNSNVIQNPIITNLVDNYVVTANQAAYLWSDPIATTAGDPTTGIINSNSLIVSLPNTAQSTTGQNVADITGFSGTLATSTGTSLYDNNVSNWETLTDFFNNNTGEGFFIDNLTFVAGQCSNNFYARNAGDPLKGNETIYGSMEWSNSLIDLYDKNVFPDVLDANNNIIGGGVRAIPTAISQVTEYKQDPQYLNYWPRLMSGQRENVPNEVRIFVNGPDEMEGSVGDVMEDESTPFYREKEEGTYRWKPFDYDSRFGWQNTNPTVHGFKANNIGDPIIEDRINTTYNIGVATSPTSGGFVHAMDGLISTTDEHTALEGIKRWRGEGELNCDTWNSTDTTYGTVNGKHFLHLSFLAPGDDLMPDGLTASDLNGINVKGIDSLGTKLQAIYGGGIFTKEDGSVITGTGTSQSRIIECEGNYTTDSGTSNGTGSAFTLSGAPELGVGQGYNAGVSPTTNISYEELHDNQWEPTYPLSRDPDGKISEFKLNLSPGNSFKFTADTSNTVYTINSVTTKRLYNHTPWRRRFVWDSASGLVAGGDSVEEAAIAWGESIGTPDETTKAGDLAEKIENFAEPNNRRVVYIIELDKDPTAQPFNPVGGTALLDANVPSDIEFIQNNPSVLTGRVSTQPAIWETEPRQAADLDIYYEASGAIPCRLNFTNREVFAPIGCELEFINLLSATSGISGVNNLIDWDSASALKFQASPGFNVNDSSGNNINYIGKKIKFIKKDGSFTTGEITSASTINGTYIESFEIKENVANRNEVGLSWFNCFSFGNGVESDRVRDDFNQAQIGNGARASTTTEEPYQEETRKYGLIFSGLYNSNSGLNELNQFIMAEKITKDINPTYGSIQKLFSRQTDLVTFCEDRVIKILANKDALFNADGNPEIVGNFNVLGQTVPFVGDYGISQNPESFAKESYRAYFTDQNRGAVLRLSQDGLTPISDAGMHDWFRDNLPSAGNLLGTYDDYKKNYNLTLKQAINENIIVNADISQGTVVTTSIQFGSELLTNTLPTGVDLSYSNVLPLDPGNSSSASYAGIINPVLNTQPVVDEYDEIPVGYFQSEITAGTSYVVDHIVNGDFQDTNAAVTTADFWSQGVFSLGSSGGVNFMMASGLLHWDSLIQYNVPVSLNKTYVIQYQIKNASFTAGGVRTLLLADDGAGNTSGFYYQYGPARTANGTYSESVTLTTNSALTQGWGANIFAFETLPNTDGIFEIHNVSIMATVTTPSTIPNIPDTIIEPWAEVSTSIIDWTFDQPQYVTFINHQNAYGPINASQLTAPVSGSVIDFNPQSSTFGTVIPSGSYSWYAPNPNQVTLHTNETGGPDPHNNPDGNYNYATDGTVSFVPTVFSQPQIDDAALINSTGATNNTVTLSQALASGHEMQTNSFYMLDIAYDNVIFNAAEEISIDGVIDSTIAVNLNPGDTGYPEGHLGETLGSGAIRLVSHYPNGDPITKQYYVGDPTGTYPGQNTDPVYRAIFKLTTSNISTLTVKFKNFIGQVKGVWLSKLDALPTGGTIDSSWTQVDQWSYLVDSNNVPIGTSAQIHSLVVPDKYFKDGKFNFNYSKTGRLRQDLSVTPTPTSDGYRLQFTLDDAISQIESTSVPISGRLYGFVTGEDGSGNKTGIRFESVLNPAAGIYRIFGNLDGQGPYSAQIYNNSTAQWQTTTNFAVDDYQNQTGNAPTGASRVFFSRRGSQFTGALKQFSLKDMTTVFSGVSAFAWNFTGNVSTVSPYVQFLNQQIVFDNATTTAQAEQVIQQIQDNTTYEINFDYDITNGSLEIYYFNANDLGFRINLTASTGLTGYSQQFVIGDATRASGELSETFVIRSSTNGTNATIDNISMQQVLVTNETTVSFNEDVGGWTSFKSFIPESGASMSKKYYTMKDGGLYQHHYEGQDRNTFYGVYNESTLTAILNADPSIVKIFNTLNYEGSQSKIDVYAVGTANDGTTLNDIQPYNTTAKNGWYIDYIKTDKQEGTLSEFIEKEGKWFNYIRGTATDIKTSEFSFQGIGRISNNP
jgi:hypothetical protein